MFKLPWDVMCDAGLIMIVRRVKLPKSFTAVNLSEKGVFSNGDGEEDSQSMED
jgi:hypothetical protein